MLDEWIRKYSDEKQSGVQNWMQKSRYILIILVCLGLVALIWPSGNKESAEISGLMSTANSDSTNSSKAQLSSELESILAQVEGAGEVHVSISIASDGVKSYASNTRSEVRDTEETDKNGGERNIKEESNQEDIAVSAGKPLLIESRSPEITGVLVVAEGARDARIKEKLTDITITLLDISAHQVRVVAGKE